MRKAVLWQRSAGSGSRPSFTGSSPEHSVFIAAPHLDVSRGQTAWDQWEAKGAWRWIHERCFQKDSDGWSLLQPRGWEEEDLMLDHSPRSAWGFVFFPLLLSDSRRSDLRWKSRLGRHVSAFFTSTVVQIFSIVNMSLLILANLFISHETLKMNLIMTPAELLRQFLTDKNTLLSTLVLMPSALDLCWISAWNIWKYKLCKSKVLLLVFLFLHLNVIGKTVSPRGPFSGQFIIVELLIVKHQQFHLFFLNLLRFKTSKLWN